MIESLSRLALYLVLLSALCVRAETPADYVFEKLVVGHETTMQYPQRALSKGLEAWAYFSYTIGKDGRVREAEILDSNGIHLIDEALLSGVKSLQFEPATLNGEPVEVRIPRERSVFVLSGKARSADFGFSRRYKKAKKALAEGRLEEAGELLAELNGWPARNLFEELFLQGISSAYHARLGDLDRMYLHLRRVLDFHESYLQRKADPGDAPLIQIVAPEYYIPFLAQAYQYELDAMRLGDALRTAASLGKIAPEHETTRLIVAHAERLSERVQGRQHTAAITLGQPIYGGDRRVLSIYLLKNEFELTDVSGELDYIELRCDGGRRRLNHQPGKAWIVPGSWGQCSVLIEGPVGLSFKLTEHPSGTLAS